MGLADFFRRLFGLNRRRRLPPAGFRGPHRHSKGPLSGNGRKGRGKQDRSMRGDEPMFGYHEANYTREREAVYRAMWGAPVDEDRELFPFIPHIEVYRFGPNGRRNFCTLVTGGMSDLPMNAPPGFEDDCSRVELMLYVRQPRELHVGLLRRLAHMVHDHESWVWIGHSVPNGNPPQPVFKDSQLDTILLLRPPISPDDSLGDHLAIEGQPVNALWVCPVTQAEAQMKWDEGLPQLLAKAKFPVVLDEHRHSFVQFDHQ